MRGDGMRGDDMRGDGMRGDEIEGHLMRHLSQRADLVSAGVCKKGMQGEEAMGRGLIIISISISIIIIIIISACLHR